MIDVSSERNKLSTGEEVALATRQLGERLKPMYLCQMTLPADGNCQFRALSHQLYGSQACGGTRDLYMCVEFLWAIYKTLRRLVILLYTFVYM